MFPLALTLPIHHSSTLRPPLISRPLSSSSSSSSFFASLSFFRPNQRIVIGGRTVCRAELSHDAPFAAAIGACVLSSLLLPVEKNEEDEDGDSAFDGDDSRLVVMAMISFIPYFNWLSWVFAWLDTGKRRYAVYSLVYLVPYFRSNLSLSPDESWLPIASIICCILHVQLEMSIKNGDIQGFQFFSEASKHVSSTPSKGSKSKKANLPPGDERLRNSIRGWGIPKKPLHDSENLKDDRDEDERRKR